MSVRVLGPHPPLPFGRQIIEPARQCFLEPGLLLGPLILDLLEVRTGLFGFGL
jgi:hypothetical protein